MIYASSKCGILNLEEILSSLPNTLASALEVLSHMPKSGVVLGFISDSRRTTLSKDHKRRWLPGWWQQSQNKCYFTEHPIHPSHPPYSNCTGIVREQKPSSDLIKSSRLGSNLREVKRVQRILLTALYFPKTYYNWSMISRKHGWIPLRENTKLL